MNLFKALLYVLILSFFVLFSCKKSQVETLNNAQLIIGKWKINEVRLNISYNGAVIRDSLLELDPQPENFIQFNTEGSLIYSFNRPVLDSGRYVFITEDSVNATLGGALYKWKILLLTKQIFNVQNTQPYLAIPGATAIVYQTMVK